MLLVRPFCVVIGVSGADFEFWEEGVLRSGERGVERQRVWLL